MRRQFKLTHDKPVDSHVQSQTRGVQNCEPETQDVRRGCPQEVARLHMLGQLIGKDVHHCQREAGELVFEQERECFERKLLEEATWLSNHVVDTGLLQ